MCLLFNASTVCVQKLSNKVTIAYMIRSLKNNTIPNNKR